VSLGVRIRRITSVQAAPVSVCIEIRGTSHIRGQHDRLSLNTIDYHLLVPEMYKVAFPQ
jgi:hypothetical protein